jgi:hypothetical protein
MARLDTRQEWFSSGFFGGRGAAVENSRGLQSTGPALFLNPLAVDVLRHVVVFGPQSEGV